jgi:uncharacterized membrane protein
MHTYTNRRSRSEQLAVGLGWFSVGLGVAELAAPRSIARLIGARDDDRTTTILQSYGARELANGVAILAQPDRAAWLWARVVGDGVDLSSLSSLFNADETDRGRLGAAIAAVVGVAALDILCATELRARRAAQSDASARQAQVQIVRATTINRPIEEVYAFWRDFENLPRFMRHLESVSTIDERRSRWRAKAPAGMTVEWEAEIIEKRENERIAWRSLPGADVDNDGSVSFQHAPGARGTEVRVMLRYRPPAGTLGRTIAWLFGEEPDQQIHEDLHRFKQLMETGEIPLSEGFGLWRPAQPAKRAEDVRSLAGVAQ